MTMPSVVRGLAVCATALLAGCAPNYVVRPVPEAISTAPADDPGLHAVTTDPARFEGRAVRWGGTVSAREPGDGRAVFRVLARALDGNGQPLPRGTVLGEFVLRPSEATASLETGVDITVAGTLAGTTAVGEGNDRVPVVEPATVYAWDTYPGYNYYPYSYVPYYCPYPYY